MKGLSLTGGAIRAGGEQEFEAGFAGGGVGGFPSKIPSQISLGIRTDFEGVSQLGFKLVGAGQINIRGHRQLGIGSVHLSGDNRIAKLRRLGAADGRRAAATTAATTGAGTVVEERFTEVENGPPRTTS